MVTTRPPRREPVQEEELDDENSIHVYVPTSSSKRRKRTEVKEDSDLSGLVKTTTPSPKKRKVLPVRVKDEEEGTSPKTRVVVEIPAGKMKPQPERLDAIESTEIGTKPKHRRFGSEDVAEEFFSTAPEQTVGNEDSQRAVTEEGDDEDSDDGAPEAIGMQEAAQTVKSREKDAAKAVKEQISAAKHKRKERDEALRKQSAAARKSKPKPGKEVLDQNEVIQAELDGPENEEGDAGINDMKGREDGIRTTPITAKQGLPDLLPLEFLEDDDPAEVMAIEEQPRKASKKKKFKDLAEKLPKDRRIGGTTYRVTKAQSTNLAPKSSFNARSTKESWLQGRSGKKVDPSRKPFSRGFFKK